MTEIQCETEVAVYGPHEGCREFTPEPEHVYRCANEATCLVEFDDQYAPMGVERMKVCADHVEPYMIVVSTPA